MNYYELLNIPFDATTDQIKQAYRALVKRLHPDHHPDINPQYFRSLHRIYETLLDEKKRDAYNQELLESRQFLAPDDTHLPTIPQKRIIYNATLDNVVKANLLNKKKPSSRDDFLAHFKADITVLLSPYEVNHGCIVSLSMSARSRCTECMGINRSCPVCDGKGMVSTTHPLPICIPKNIPNQSILDINPKEYRMHTSMHFVSNLIRILVIHIPA